jgi:hypothetical protein
MFCKELYELTNAASLILNLTEYSACHITWFNMDNFVCAKKIQNNTETQKKFYVALHSISSKKFK